MRETEKRGGTQTEPLGEIAARLVSQRETIKSLLSCAMCFPDGLFGTTIEMIMRVKFQLTFC